MEELYNNNDSTMERTWLIIKDNHEQEGGMQEALDDNMSNDLRTPAGRIRKDNEQQDETMKRKEELADPNMTVDDKMSYDPCTSAVTVRKDSKQSDMSMNRKDGSVEDNMIFDHKMGNDPYTPAITVRKDGK